VQVNANILVIPKEKKYCKVTLQIRTTFILMCLLNDASQMHNAPFIQNGKEWGENKIERERENG
jgi:hypothetical protein